jgi:hypothetical protein
MYIKKTISIFLQGFTREGVKGIESEGAGLRGLVISKHGHFYLSNGGQIG